MGPVWALLLLLLLPIAQGAETFCDARKNNTQCYGALGGSIQIQLMDSGSKERCKWIKKELKVFEWRNNRNITNIFKDRSELNASTGIFQLRNLSKSDNDSYTLEYIDENGLSIKKILHDLIIEARVSSLDLQHRYLSKGEVQVNWTSEGGDNTEFSCTLNGHSLTDFQLLPKNETSKTIILKQNTVGLLNCSVKNHISEVYKTLNISNCDWILKNNTLCSAPTTSAPITVGKTSALTPSTNQTLTSTPDLWYIQHKEVIAGAVAGVLFLFVIAAIALFCVLKRKSKNNNDEDQELTYADVRIVQQPGRRPQQQMSEVEVEYGQVKFSNQNQPAREAPGDACIYAMVRR